MQEISKFSERLSELMFYNDNIASYKLAQKLGFGISTISQWKTGKRSPTLSNAVCLANYFGCSLDFLSERIDDDIKFTPQPLLPFPERLVQILKERKVSWYKVTIDTKLSESNMRDWRRGCLPHLPILIELADYLNVSIDYLVGRDR
ncbi:MAG: helix-turn-helix domain-containing protein [Firmicutes bacterium]|nr:helix-turn-helix domain-containing protein [Bacillota bacterium]